MQHAARIFCPLYTYLRTIRILFVALPLGTDWEQWEVAFHLLRPLIWVALALFVQYRPQPWSTARLNSNEPGAKRCLHIVSKEGGRSNVHIIIQHNTQKPKPVGKSSSIMNPMFAPGLSLLTLTSNQKGPAAADEVSSSFASLVRLDECGLVTTAAQSPQALGPHSAVHPQAKVVHCDVCAPVGI